MSSELHLAAHPDEVGAVDGRIENQLASANLAAGFLHLAAHIPFPVEALQADGGGEFVAE